MGLKYKFPLIWCPTKPYRDDYTLNKAEERQCWKYLLGAGVDPGSYAFLFAPTNKPTVLALSATTC